MPRDASCMHVYRRKNSCEKNNQNTGTSKPDMPPAQDAGRSCFEGLFLDRASFDAFLNQKKSRKTLDYTGLS